MPRPTLPSNPAQRARAKAELLRDAANHPSFSRPWTAGGVVIAPTLVLVDDLGRLIVYATAHDAGTAVPLDLPFIYVNPPVLVPDPTGDIVVPGGLDPQDRPRPDRRLRFDAAEAFRQVVTETVLRPPPPPLPGPPT